VRENRGGELFTHAYGEVIAAHIDPIEKKPLYHFLPGSVSFSIATSGCNFQCPFCQNWQISQSSKTEESPISGTPLPPEKVVEQAVENRCQSISYTYTEPTIFFEYAFDTSKLAKKKGIANVFVTNGYMTEKALELICPYLDACNVDLKSFRDEFYRDMCRARLDPVLDSIKKMKDLKIWVEVTTLIVPGQNDSDVELSQIADFIAGIDRDIPWHISRYHPDYKFIEAPATPLETLRRAFETGRKAGLRYVYIGNVTGESDVTFCPECRDPLILRQGYTSRSLVERNHSCPKCGAHVSGVFSQ
jgi:pyruvate formate lyase activating enzyme